MLETTVGALFRKAVAKFPRRVAVKQDDRVLTYAQLGERVNRFANALLGLGLTPGDRVVLLMWNCPEYVVCDLAVAVAGLVKVPLNHLLSLEEVLFRIQDSEAAVAVCDEAFAPMVRELRRECPSLRHVIGIGRAEGDVIPFESLLARGAARPPDVTVSHEDLLGIMYTGGTTGRSKGVMHTHKSVVAIGFSQMVEFDIGWGEVLLQMAPLPHAAQFTLLTGFLRGGTHVLMRKFDPDQMLHRVEQERASWTFMVPTMMYVLLEDPALGRYQRSSLRTVMYGGAPIRPDRLERIIERMGPIFLQSFAQMEAANQITTLTKAEHVEALREAPGRLASCGRPVAMTQVRIVDADGGDVAPGEAGEIVLRGPHVMTGYWRRPDETARVIREGWLHTGDVARADEDGYVYIVDRVKDMIITGGMNVYSVEVENVLARHPAVREACVIGVPDDKWGEAVTAFVTVWPGRTVDGKELIDFCEGKLAAYSRPKRVELVDEIPKTPYGKPDKKAIRTRFWKDATRQVH